MSMTHETLGQDRKKPAKRLEGQQLFAIWLHLANPIEQRAYGSHKIDECTKSKGCCLFMKWMIGGKKFIGNILSYWFFIFCERGKERIDALHQWKLGEGEEDSRNGPEHAPKRMGNVGSPTPLNDKNFLCLQSHFCFSSPLNLSSLTTFWPSPCLSLGACMNWEVGRELHGSQSK